MKKIIKKTIITFFVCLSIVVGLAGKCKKPKTPPPVESSLQVTLDPAVNTVQSPVPLVSFPLKVTINSTMPAQGVTIVVASKKDDGSSDPAFFNTNQNTTTAVNNFTITNTPVSVVCITTVTVTSRSTASNTWTGSYRYSRKP